MKYSYNWLKELSGTNLSAEKATEILTMRSFELESVEKVGTEFEKVVVGQILEIKKHPNADKLQIARVSIGAQTLDIVCGANNISVGDKVPVALVGAKLPGGGEIKEAQIRGEKSFGMLCAKDELGLGEDHSGIFILEKNAKIGTPLSKYLNLEDTIFEIKVLPDRAHDAMSHVGVAREIAALEKKKMEYDFGGIRLPVKRSDKLKIKITAADLCSRYIGAVLENIKIQDSPQWMKERLKSAGIKSINNVVDATNYVMLELGQPLHAFDAEKILRQETKNKKQETRKIQIVVRRAKEDEELKLLDETGLKLSENDLLITNGETPLALAGIMGGADSGISSGTKTILLEAANFNAVNIRRTRARLGVKTESSDRYEKEIDPNLCEKALSRVIEILEHTASAKLEAVVDVYPKKIQPWKIKLDLAYVNELLGETVSRREILQILNFLEIKSKNAKIKTIKSEFIEALIPTFRIDLKTQEDLIEEIGRLHGYEKIESQPIVSPVEPVKQSELLLLERKIGEKMIGLGYDEMYNYSFYSFADAEKCQISEKHLELANPMNPDQELVRTSLIPNILKNIFLNLKNFEKIAIFEIGRTYSLDEAGVREGRGLIAAEVLDKDKSSETFFSLKGTLEKLLESFNLKEFSFSVISESKGPWHLSRTASVSSLGEKIGTIGEIHPAILAKFKISKRVAIFEIDIQKLLRKTRKEITFEPIRKFPAIVRDLSLLSLGKVTVSEIAKHIQKSGGNLVRDVKIFDVFKKDEKTSLAFRIEFASSRRTLEGKEVEVAMEKIISSLEKELHLEVRK